MKYRKRSNEITGKDITINTGDTKYCFHVVSPCRYQNQLRAPQSRAQHQSQSLQPAVGLQVLLDSGAPSSGIAGHSMMTRHCLKVGLAN